MEQSYRMEKKIMDYHIDDRGTHKHPLGTAYPTTNMASYQHMRSSIVNYHQRTSEPKSEKLPLDMCAKRKH